MMNFVGLRSAARATQSFQLNDTVPDTPVLGRLVTLVTQRQTPPRPKYCDAH